MVEEPQKDQNQNIVKTQREKSEKDIAEGLSKLKSAVNSVKGTLELKMPSRFEDQKADVHQEIKIPVPKRLIIDKETGAVMSSNVHGQPLVYEKEKIEAARKTLQEQNKELNKESPQKQEDSIFGGKTEISRRELEYQLRRNPKAWQAERQAGLTLSPTERAKLVKDIPRVYGGDISASDIRGTIRGLNRKLIDAKNPEQHAKIRKEIKFFKKIQGG